MEPEQDWYRAVLKQVSSESQEVLDFLVQQEKSDKEVLDLFFGDSEPEPEPELERQDFHLD